MNKNGTFLDSGISKLNYYNEIPRTSDLLKSAEFAFGTSNILISNFYIAPASIRFDNLVEEVLFELNRAVSRQMDVPDKDDIINLSIAENIHKYENTEAKDEFRKHLQREGYSGELIRVAGDLNNSTIDQFTRAILSEEGIFFYLAYRAIIGNEIEDPAGIASNILDSLGRIKSYINVFLVNKVIAKENLDVSSNEKNRVRKLVENKQISYFPGNPEKVIVKLIDELKSGGKLFSTVMEFLNSGKVKLPRGTEKEALAQKMVDYLQKLGYTEDLDPESEHNPQPGPTPNPEDPQLGMIETPDDFQIIENVGPATNKKFLNAGIRSFAQLASFSVEGLRESLQEPMSHINYESIIEQAKMITKGSFRELIKYQEKLNKR